MKLTESEARAILDLDPGADASTIRQAYLDIVNVWHPDRFKGHPRLEAKAQEKLKRINAAYERLDPAAGRTARPAGRTEPSRPNPPSHPAPAPPAPIAKERRHSPRVTVRIPVQFRSKRDAGSRSSLNVGRGGIAIGTPHPLGRNEMSPLRFLIPGSDSHIFVQARVAWVIPATAMGLQFQDLKPADQATLAAFVDAHAGTEGIVTVCDQCGALLRVAVGDLGRVVRCRCRHTFTVA